MPRRPLAVLGFSAFFAAIATAQMGPHGAKYFAAACGGLLLCAILAAIALRRRKKARLPILGLTMGLAACCVVSVLYGISYSSSVLPYEGLHGVEAHARMQILDYPQPQYGRFYYNARVFMLDYQMVEPFNIRVSSQDGIYFYSPGDFVDCDIKLQSFSSDGLFSAKAAQAARGNALSAYVTGGRTQCARNLAPGLSHYLAQLRNHVGRCVSTQLTPESSGMVRAILLGQRGYLSSETYGSFRRLGVSHLLATSGLHMAAVAAAVSLLINRLPLGFRWRNFIKSLAIIMYLCLTGFPVSALRSACMFLIMFLGDSIGRRPDSLNSLGAAALLICLLRPLSGGDLGFVLSVLSTAGIIVMYTPLMSRFMGLFREHSPLRRILKPILASVCVSISVAVFTLPVQIMVFGGLPVLSLPANLLLIPLVGLFLYFSILLVFLSPAAALGAARPLALLTEWTCRLISAVANWLGGFPFTFLALRKSQGWWALCILCLAATVITALWVSMIKRTGRAAFLSSARMVTMVRLLMGGTALLLALNFGLSAFRQWDTLSVAVAGESDSFTVIVMRRGRAAALCLGGYRSGAAEEILADNNVITLDSLFLSTTDPDAVRMASALLSVRKAGRLILRQGDYLDPALRKFSLTPDYLSPESSCYVLPGLSVRLSSDGNCLSFEQNGYTLAIETGKSAPDIHSCDILITGRHSSPISSRLALLPGGEEQDSVLTNALSHTAVPARGYLQLDLEKDGSMLLSHWIDYD